MASKKAAAPKAKAAKPAKPAKAPKPAAPVAAAPPVEAAVVPAKPAKVRVPARDKWAVTVNEDCEASFGGVTYRFPAGRTSLVTPKGVEPSEFAIHFRAALQPKGAIVELED